MQSQERKLNQIKNNFKIKCMHNLKTKIFIILDQTSDSVFIFRSKLFLKTCSTLTFKAKDSLISISNSKKEIKFTFEFVQPMAA